MTTRELFFLVTSKRMWYKELNISPAHASMIKERARTGKFSECKMYDVLVKLGYQCRWEEENDSNVSIPSKKTDVFEDKK